MSEEEKTKLETSNKADYAKKAIAKGKIENKRLKLQNYEEEIPQSQLVSLKILLRTTQRYF